MAEHVGKALAFGEEHEQSDVRGDYAGRNVIFLDVDGVLNCMGTTDTVMCFTGLDADCIRILREIVQVFDAYIILSSSWKERWSRDDKESQDIFGNTLDARLAEFGLVIMDRTYDNGWERGRGIVEWLEKHGPVKSFMILDDEEFDFERCGIIDHWVPSTYYDKKGGLREKHLMYIRGNLSKFQA